MQGSIVTQGVELMLFGMGTVLVFLTVLVLSIVLMSWVLRRYFPEQETSPEAIAARGRPPLLQRLSLPGMPPWSR